MLLQGLVGWQTKDGDLFSMFKGSNLAKIKGTLEWYTTFINTLKPIALTREGEKKKNEKKGRVDTRDK
jgi:hypothetical protein